ncbi:MAG: MMPL family transporter, partial [Bacteroidales bacterium]|nr:MMPL family transporter [Bacteroidales bacterium]
MERLFLGIFFLIQKFKVVSLAAFALLIALAGYFAYQIQLSEDVSKLLPEKNIPVNLIENLEAIDFADRLFFHLHLKDSNAYKPDALIEIATALTDSLAHKNQDSLIQSLFYTVEASSIENTYQLILKYLPFYLQEQDYPAIEEMIQSENLEKNFRKKYKTLFSPASMFMRKMITKDPVGISLEPLKRLQTFQFDTSFILYKNIVFTSDKKHLLFYLTPKYKSSDTKNNGRLIAFIDEQIDQIQLADDCDVEIHYFGAPAVAYANSKQIKADIILTVLIALFAIVLLVALFYRRKRLYFIIFLPAALSVLFSLSILSFFKGEISAIALGMGSILVGISIDYVFHIFTHAQNGH